MKWLVHRALYIYRDKFARRASCARNTEHTEEAPVFVPETDRQAEGPFRVAEGMARPPAGTGRRGGAEMRLVALTGAGAAGPPSFVVVVAASCRPCWAQWRHGPAGPRGFALEPTNMLGPGAYYWGHAPVGRGPWSHTIFFNIGKQFSAFCTFMRTIYKSCVIYLLYIYIYYI